MRLQTREFGSEYDWNSNFDFFLPEDQESPRFLSAKKYRSGRDALKAVAQACKGQYTRVMMSALCCESMVSPFTMNGIAPFFYRMNQDYTANMDDVSEQLTNDTIFLYAPYFGVSPFSKEQLEQLHDANPEALFLEDRTQDVLYSRADGFWADVTIASIRKWIAIPDGGVLWSKRIALSDGKPHKKFGSVRTEAMKKKSIYLENADPELKRDFRELLSEAAELLDESATAYAMTSDSEQLLRQIDFEKLYACRKKNIQALKVALMPALCSGKLRTLTENLEISTLYFPVLTDKQEQLQKRLAGEGIYCPVIWPVPMRAKGICPVAEYTATHMLAIPCDHRYTPDDMHDIGATVVRICSEL